MARFSKAPSAELERAVSIFEKKKKDFKNYVDYRLPENRKKAFNKYYRWRVTTYDLDHTHYLSTLAEGYDYERKAWLAMCFGMTYRTPQAFAYAETFEHPNKYSEREINEWHEENWSRTTYGTDARYNKGHFNKQMISVKNWLDGATFKEKFDSICTSENQYENFTKLYGEIRSLWKYGRMTGWLALQGLYDLLKLPIDPNQILLEGFSPNSDSSLQSIWNGMCEYLNREDLLVGKYGTHTCTDDDVKWGRKEIMDIVESNESTYHYKVDSFRRESIFCQYKRLFNKEMSLEYPGHASGDATSRYLYYREYWPEINWYKFRKALRTQPGLVKGQTFVPWKNQLFGRTGSLINLHEAFDDEINMYEACELDPNEYLVREIWEDDNLEVPVLSPHTSSYKEDIKTSPKYWVEL